MPYLKIKSSTVDIEVTFKDKYAFIVGNSGVGKSMLIETISKQPFEGAYVESDLDYTIMSRESVKYFDAIPEGSLVIADEIYLRKFINKLSSKNCYFFLVTRNVSKGVNISQGCLYHAFRDTDGITRINPVSPNYNI